MQASCAVSWLLELEVKRVTISEWNPKRKVITAKITVPKSFIVTVYKTI
jgi:hypothetical protein